MQIESDLCRACLVLLSKEDGLLLEADLALQFLECTSLTVNLLDEFPKSLCGNCYEMLLKFHAFRAMCAESILNFRNLFDEELKSLDGHEEPTAEAPTTGSDQVGLVEEEEGPPKMEEVYIINTFENEEYKDEDISTGHTNETKRLHQEKTRSETEPYYIFVNSKLKVFYCAKCPRRFYKEEGLMAHARTHNGMKPYACNCCAKEFTRASTLHNHMAEFHAGQSATYHCTHEGCTKVYTAKRTLRKHIQERHTTHFALTDDHICEVCGKIFKRKSFLSRHRYIHMDKSKYPFACEHCGKRFYVKQFLRGHLNRHAKKFVCL